ncbi:RHS repeat-associated core domain-containing protein [Flavobacterium zepuense]|uniref:RHS repeat-associated core domain-containing protein n=2 Tax=Flavobacterium zepuense TaxID=2593302 RepID=A0A552UTN2_9FLAO|nr:RHS repeat-associated core domain-containing protein [Flavobacterium zepuense]
MTQDENQRVPNVNDWLFTKYDVYGRVIYTGNFLNSKNETRKTLQTIFNNTYSGNALNEIRTITPFQNSDTDIYYQGTAVYPINTNEYQVYAINYYDNYNNINLSASDVLSTPVPNQNYYGRMITNKPIGLLTVTRTKILGTSNWVTSATAYDNKARPIWIYTNDTYLGTRNKVDSDLTFTGKPITVRTMHNRAASGSIPATSATYIDSYTYDNSLRPLKITRQIGGVQRLQSWNKYDELGKLLQKKVGGVAGTSYDATPGLQTVDHSYNVRGWLKGINNADENLTGYNDLFAFKINYNLKDLPQSTSLYNGNINETHWRSITDNVIRSYSYNYDALNRLTDADYMGDYKLDSGQAENYKEGLISYDKNGNIKHLERWGLKNNNVVDKIDVLTYEYAQFTNKLEGVSDTAGDAGFINNGTGTNADYIYDDNGNMTSDQNKNIVKITYNHLNLPDTIVFTGANRFITYLYDAAGGKVEKKVNDGSNITITQYDGEIIYDKTSTTATIQSIMNPEGYAKRNTDGTYSYIYQYKDHLGNVRLSYSDTDNNGIINDSQTFKDGFESQSGWDGDVPMLADIAQQHTGSRSGKFINTNTDGTEKYQFMDVWVPINNTSTTNYTLSYWVKSNGPSAEAFLYTKDAAGNVNVPYVNGPSDQVTTVGSWVQKTKSISVPVTARYIRLRLDNNGQANNNNSTNNTVWFDDIQLKRAAGNSEIIEENNYYAFGMQHKGYNNVVSTNGNPQAQKYKYNGKELQDELGLNMYDYGARNYDPALGRWFNIDPKAETSRRWSPYTYCYDNPLRFTDPDGMQADDWVKKGKSLVYDEAVTSNQQAVDKYGSGAQVVNDDSTITPVNGYSYGYTLKGDGTVINSADNSKVNLSNGGFTTPGGYEISTAEDGLDIGNVSDAVGLGMAVQEVGLTTAQKTADAAAEVAGEVSSFSNSANKLLKATKGLGAVAGVVSAGVAIYDLTQNPSSPGAWAKAIVNTTLAVGGFNPVVGIVTGILDATGVTDKIYQGIDKGMQNWNY